MLVEFRVTNFKSIRDAQVFSMVAGKDSSLENNLFKPEGASFNLLKSAAIYGPNAGGKSNLLQAVGFVIWSLSRRTFNDSGPFWNEYAMCPFFKLDMESRNKPSEFEITYLDNGIRYQYGFALLGERVAEEWLLVYQSAKPQEWFHRWADDKTDEDVYKFSSYFKGQKETWKKSTRKEALFLSVAAELNSKQLMPVCQALLNISVLNNARAILPDKLMEAYIREDKRKKEILLGLLNAADIGITDIDIKTKIFKVPKRNSPDKDGSISEFVEGEIKRPIFIHSHDGVGERFELEEESEGTRRFFALAFRILEALEHGSTLIVDELESSLHPNMARFVVGLFNSADNKKGAQLIFATHNTNLLDTKKTLRRDQIWFVEKDASQATVLYPLTDFKIRKAAAAESGYLTGKYGAVPFITEFNIKEPEAQNAAPSEGLGHGAR